MSLNSRILTTRPRKQGQTQGNATPNRIGEEAACRTDTRRFDLIKTFKRFLSSFISFGSRLSSAYVEFLGGDPLPLHLFRLKGAIGLSLSVCPRS